MTERIMPWPAHWSARDAEWHAWRTQGIGGSDIAAIAGMSTFASPMSVYLDKLGMLPEGDESDRMRWGRLLEPAIAQEFEETTGLYVGMTQALAVDPDHPWQRATLDGLAYETRAADRADGYIAVNELGVVEIKCTEDSQRAWDEQIPDRIALQVQWQMGVSGVHHGWLASLHRGNTFRVEEIDFQPAVYSALTTLATRFWHDHVLAQVPPPADSNPATTAALKDAFDTPIEDAVELNTDAAEAITEWLRAKAFAKTAASDVELIENHLRASLGECTTGLLDGEPVVTWKQQQGRTSLDEQALADAHPEIDLDKFRKRGAPYRVLRPTKKLKEMQ